MAPRSLENVSVDVLEGNVMIVPLLARCRTAIASGRDSEKARFRRIGSVF